MSGRPSSLARLAAFGLLTIGCAVSVKPLVPISAEDARQIYLEACASCHGKDGTGNGTVAVALKTPPPDLTRLAARRQGTFPRQDVIEIIAGERDISAHGTREMPVWSQRFAPSASGATAAAAIYARQRLEALVDYLQSIQRP